MSSHGTKPFHSRIFSRFMELLDWTIVRIYVFIFARRFLQPVNRLFYRLALKGLGYDNEGRSFQDSGEAYFVDILATFSPKLCIDVGASRGGYARQLLTKTSANVISFEPHPVSFGRLSQVKAEFPDRIIIENVGVGDTAGVLKLYHGTQTGLATFAKQVNAIEYVGRTNVNSTDVRVVTLDQCYLEHLKGRFDEIDFIKIDTEGFEYEVLTGAQKLISDMRPKFIQLEFNVHHAYRGHPMPTFADLLPQYRLYQIMPYRIGLIERNPRSLHLNIYEYSNFVFVRPDLDVSGA